MKYEFSHQTAVGNNIIISYFVWQKDIILQAIKDSLRHQISKSMKTAPLRQNIVFLFVFKAVAIPHVRNVGFKQTTIQSSENQNLYSRCFEHQSILNLRLLAVMYETYVWNSKKLQSQKMFIPFCIHEDRKPIYNKANLNESQDITIF